MFTQSDGDRLHPQHVSDQFLWLAYLAGLPPIRLHDLRHGAASLMLAAGVEIKVVQETLGHTSSAFTADTYTSVFPQVAMAAAEKTAALLLGDDEGRGVLRQLRVSPEGTARPGEMMASLRWHHGGAKPSSCGGYEERYDDHGVYRVGTGEHGMAGAMFCSGGQAHVSAGQHHD
ncbi:tyrosine-type recombinase/integrase [Nonomuraea sp. NPDC050540]|uniref:tyrosine-type recombinase/integrase n=1 Tax=Nonomuraea sp. NPDC050540 TaxID=3364367 RepID=UPI0037A1F60A